MTSYKLVRVRRFGRQSIEESTHLIKINSNETVCGQYSSDDLRTVRTLGIYTGDSPVCDECAKEVDKNLKL